MTASALIGEGVRLLTQAGAEVQLGADATAAFWAWRAATPPLVDPSANSTAGFVDVSAVRLHILDHAAEQPVHGAWMSVELARHGYAISPGTLYPTLHRMEAEGLLTSHAEVVYGRTRRVYRATAAGLAALADGRRAVAELAAEVLPRGEPLEQP